ncbi:MAG TPA: ABC transporter permease, partial [Acidobacteriota bacterium]|nr:ABC transporter permease [Acidobacteriota bacterium]
VRLYLDILSAVRIGPERFAIRRLLRPRKGNVMLSNLKQDLSYSLRRLIKSPGFALVCVLTLALGIGANTAMFSVINGVLLEPLPYPEPDRLVRIHTKWNNFGYGSINELEYLDILEGTDVFQDLVLYDLNAVNMVQGSGPPERVLAARITPSLFSALGLSALKGRNLQPGEETVPHHRVLLLSEGLWKRRFGGDETIIGKSLEISGQSFEVIGIMPPVDYPLREIELWGGFGIDPENPPHRGAHSSDLLGRLKPGVSLKKAHSQLDSLAARLREEYPQQYPEASQFTFFAEPLSEAYTGSVRPALLILMGAVGLVLLIACANVAGLLLARINARQREIAIRKALGASAGRLVGQALWETLLLSLMGGLGALAVAQASFLTLERFYPSSLPRMEEVGLDWTVAIFTLGLIVLTTLAAGLIPALRMTRSGSRVNLGERGGQEEGFRQRVRRVLVVKEVALATILLLGAGLLIRSFQHLMEVDPGFEAENLLTARVSLPPDRYQGGQSRMQFYHQLLDDLQARPAVLSAGVVNLVPMSGN